MRDGSTTRSRPAKAARCRAWASAVPGSTVSSSGPRPLVHAGGGHLPRAREGRERVAAVPVGDEPARDDEVLGVGKQVTAPIGHP